MKYIIHTPSATRLKKEIIDSVTEKVDGNGKIIATWQCVEADTSETVLVHTSDHWAGKGCITLNQNISHNELQVRFCYWDTCDERENGDDKIMFGRFTEFLLVHFSYYIDKISIE